MKAPKAALPPEFELDEIDVRERSLDGVVQLMGRQIVTKLLALFGGIVLARELQPSAFGLFAIANFTMAFFALFAEYGLGAALIRKPGPLTRSELNSLFVFQLVLMSGLASGLALAAPTIASIYHAPSLVALIRALAVALVLVSVRSVPMVISERRLAYGPIALSETSGQLAYWSVAVTASLAGMEVWSLVMAVVASAAVGSAVLYMRAGWLPSRDFDWKAIRRNASFGAMFQAQSVAHFFKDTMVPAFGGLAYGTAAVGYVTWGLRYTAIPLEVTNLVARVSYPALARLQNDSQEFVSLLRANLTWTTRITFPAFAVLAGLAPEIVMYVYGPKWVPALPALYFLFVNMSLSVGAGVLMPALYSAGRARAGLRISIGWTVFTWMAAVALLKAGFGFESMAIAYGVGTVLAMIGMALAIADLGLFGLAKPLVRPILAGFAIAGLLFATAPRVVHGIWSLIAAAILAGVLGIVINVWPDRAQAALAGRGLIERRFTPVTREGRRRENARP